MIYSNEHIVKKSRFICDLKFINTEDEAKDFIEQIKSEHPKARHHCYVWKLTDKREYLKMSDDGEPRGTAAAPILNVLKFNSIDNVIVVVTRYFGGKKLGAGGLIRAYSKATALTIKKIKK